MGGQGQPTKDRAIGKLKPRKAGPRSRNGRGGAGLGSGAGVPRLGSALGLSRTSRVMF